VGVASPLNMAPSRTTGVSKDQKPSRNVRQNGICGAGLTFTFRLQNRNANVAIIIKPVKTPGITPPRNNKPTGTLAILPKITILMLGGMIGPMVDVVVITPMLRSSGESLSLIPFIPIWPTLASSATAQPHIPADIISATTLV